MQTLGIQAVETIAISGHWVDSAQCIAQVEKVLEQANMLILRQQQYSTRSIKVWNELLPTIQHRFPTKMISFNGDSSVDVPSGISRHFKSHLLTSATQTINQQNNVLVGISCHTQQQAIQAEKAGLDYILLSPIKQANSHANEFSLMGWSGYRQIVKKVNMPVFALGGMQISDLKQAKSVGGAGIASISAFWT